MDMTKLSDADLQAISAGNMAGVSDAGLKMLAGTASSAPPESKPWSLKGVLGQQRDMVAGAIRGAGSIGATLLSPLDAAARAVGVQNEFIGRNDRREAMDAALRDLVGADTESISYGGGKLAAEVAGTSGVGKLLATAAGPVLRTVAPTVAPKVLAALETGGMSTRAAPAASVAGKAADLGLRVAAGATTGAAAAGLVDPDSVASGAAIGAVLPPALTMAGAAGRGAAWAARALSQPWQIASAEDLAKAVGAAGPDELRALIQQLREAPELVPGSRPTVAQALNSPAASIAERVIHDSAGGGKLRDQLVRQAHARLAALERVTPVNPSGSAQARQDLGELVGRQMGQARQAERARVGDLFEAVDPAAEVRMRLPLDEFASAADEFLGPGTVGQGRAADQVLQEARAIGQDSLEAAVNSGRRVGGGVADLSLGQAVRRLGIHPSELAATSVMPGEVRYLREGPFGRGLVNKNGMSLAKLAERMAEDGYLPDDDVGTLINALSDEAAGSPVFSTRADPAFMAQMAGGPAPSSLPGKAIPKPVTWREAQNLRSSINDLWSEASGKGRSREAAALQKMMSALDNAIDDAASGKLAPDEAFPEHLAARWREAIDQFSAFKQRFDTGPQASMFRNGANGEPARQGGEIASAFWGVRPGLADDVQAFRRLVQDKPDLMQQFRSMVTTEGSERARGGDLSVRFAQWVRQTLPGLKEAFTPEQVDVLKRIARDITRADRVANLARGPGSNTFQNAANALDLGVLDSRLANVVAERVPLGGAALSWVREGARKGKADRLAGLFADSGEAAQSLDAALQYRLPSRPKQALTALGASLAPLAYRAGPLAATDP